MINFVRRLATHRPFSWGATAWRHLARSHSTPWHLLNRVYYWPLYTLPVWWHVVNRKARLRYEREPVAVNEGQRRLVDELRVDGIALAHFDDLFDVGFEALRERAEGALLTAESKEKIGNAERMLAAGQGPGRYWRVELHDLFDMDSDDLLVRISLSDNILGIACGYLGMHCRLRCLNLWYSLPIQVGVKGERWHRDPEDKRLLKVFLYLRDVSVDDGPFTYVRGSQDGGRHGRCFPRKPPYASNPRTEEVLEALPREDVVACTGKAGTMIFCDTSGLHIGGHSVDDARFLFNTEYVTDGVSHFNKRVINWTIPNDGGRHLTSAARHAVMLGDGDVPVSVRQQ